MEAKTKRTEWNQTWEEKNKDHANYLKGRTSTRSFIKNKAKLKDLEELEELIEKRREYLKSLG